LTRALARASGSLDRNAPDSSAWYSRDRVTAIWINSAAIGARIQASSITKMFPPPSSSLPPKKNANRARNVMLMPIAAATDETRMSRLATWESSWARTPRSSRSSRIWRIPWVTATAACSGLRPVAKAFGCIMSET
jgi:hypothetical protein